jgi:hypothetical protein
MKVTSLIAEFASHGKLPVDVNDVLAKLRENGNDDEIEFIGVDFDTDILQGKIKVCYGHPKPYGEPVRYANIYYHRGHETDWQRFICCKELLHLLDPPAAHIKTPSEIAALEEKIGLPPEMQDPLQDGLAANVDRLAEFRAAAILLPWACRELLLKPLHEHALSLDDIARMADIPRKYVGFVMSPVWATVHPLLASSTPPAANTETTLGSVG